MSDGARKGDADPTLHPVIRAVGALVIGWSWIRLLLFVGILVWLIVGGTALARVIGAVLLLVVVAWAWWSRRSRGKTTSGA